MARQSSKVAIIRYGDREVQVGHIFKVDDLSVVDEIAVLCSNVYSRNESSNCYEEGYRYPLPDWELLFRLEGLVNPRKWSYTVKGLDYEVWRKHSGAESGCVVIVFRGTDFAQLGDWFSNFRWVTRIIPRVWDQYSQVRDLLTGIVRQIQETVGDARIVAAGHSLGGGLAQMAGYLSPAIKHVYAFDSSVVTGYYSVKRRLRRQNRNGLKIYRIYEHGEALAYLRLVKKSVYPVSNKNPQIIEIRVNFSRQNPIKQHSMKHLACKLMEARGANGNNRAGTALAADATSTDASGVVRG